MLSDSVFVCVQENHLDDDDEDGADAYSDRRDVLSISLDDDNLDDVEKCGDPSQADVDEDDGDDEDCLHPNKVTIFEQI